jgi:hypothetical protein
VRQRQRGLLHRAPATVGEHRVRQVDAQRDHRRRPPLGLGDLEVLRLQAHRQGAHSPAGPAADRIADGADHVERLLVAELPAPRRADQVTGRAGVPQVVRAALLGGQVGEDLRQRGAAEPAQRLR